MLIIGLLVSCVGALFYGLRVWSDQRRAGLRVSWRSLHLKLTGAMLAVIGLDGVGYLIAVGSLPRRDIASVTVLEDIFVAVALLAVTVGLVLAGMIAHAAGEVADGAARLGRKTITDLTIAMQALARGDLDAARVQPDTTPHGELGLMAVSVNDMQTRINGATHALDEAREALRATGQRLQRNLAQQAAVVQIGKRALAGIALPELMQETSQTVAAVLEVEISAIFELQPDSGTLELRAGVGKLPPTLSSDNSSQLGHSLAVGGPVIVEDWATETRFGLSVTTRALGVRSSACVPIQGNGRPYGVIGFQSLCLRSFASDEVEFLCAVANVLADAIDRTRAEEATQHAALHDALTGLANRTLLADRLEFALVQARRDTTRVAVLFIDLDKFKVINDSRGHDVADQLLVAVAGRLAGALREGDTVARFGGDEFVIVCAGLLDPGQAVTMAQRIQGTLLEPVHIAGRAHLVSASIGIALSDGSRQQDHDLVLDADAAMYRAKQLGNGRYELFDQQMRDQTRARVRLSDELGHAIQRDELRLHYQPIIAIETGAILGVEALVRWQHPARGLVAPDEFIPAAEQTGMIAQIGHWVLTEACRQLSVWNQHSAEVPGSAPMFVAVNVSARQIQDDTLPETIERLLSEHQLTPGQLHLEITESVLLDDTDKSLVKLNRLKNVGVSLALDDFGTGYSSLSYVKRFPIDMLKIDRAFVADLGESGDGDTAIVQAILNMAKGLGLKVIAEGVETRAQAHVLLALQCKWAQGWLYAPALPAEKLNALLTAGPFDPQTESLSSQPSVEVNLSDG